MKQAANNSSGPVPGLVDLLVNPDLVSPNQRKRTKRAASNAKTVLLSGIRGLGNVLAAAAAGDFCPRANDVANVGWLVAQLSDALISIEDAGYGASTADKMSKS